MKASNHPLPDLGYLALFLGQRVNELVRDRMHRAGFGDVRDSHGYVIQHLIQKDRSITELARRMEVTQQAASKVVAELTGLGIVDVVAGADRRAKAVKLSMRGWKAVKSARRIRARIEERLIRAAGQEAYDSAKSALTVCLEALGGMAKVRSRRVRPPAEG